MKSGQVPNDEATARLAADLEAGLTSTSQAGARFEARCAEISGGASAYAIYRALSATSHASASVVDLYLASTQVDETTNPRGAALRLDPRAENRDANLGIMLSMLVAAASAWSWSRLDRHRYNRTRLKALCRDLNVGFKHELTARGLAQSRVREQEYRRWRSRNVSEARATPTD